MNYTMLNNSGIYKIQNSITGDFYIGSAVSLRGRIAVHQSLLIRNIHYNIHLQRAWNKYGEENFEFKTILICDRDNVKKYEQVFLDVLSPGYNISPNATGGSGVVTQKMRDAARRNGLALKGRKKPKSYIVKLSKRMMGNTLSLGRRMSKENKERLRKRNLGNTYFEGKEHTDKWKEYMSKKLKGRVFSEETKKKMSDSAKGSERMKNNNLFAGHVHSEESKNKMRATLKDTLARKKAEEEGSHAR